MCKAVSHGGRVIRINGLCDKWFKDNYFSVMLYCV